MQNIADLRREYSKASLDVKTINHDPIKQFEKWFHEAMLAQVTEPNAMHLATVNEQGKPSSRVVLLKGLENNKLVFYTNYLSKKGKELDANPACALTFFWPDLERQVRIEGITERVNSEISTKYFQTRPRESQIGAWASPQSSIINDRSILEERAQQMTRKFQGVESLPKPHQWGGYQVDPLLFEFWQGRPSRLHDRIEFVKIDGSWRHHRLAP